MERWLTNDLVCPRDQLRLSVERDELRCSAGHAYPIVNGVPVMLIEGVQPTMDLVSRSAQQAIARDIVDEFYLDTLGISEDEKQGLRRLVAEKNSPVDPAVSYLVGATNGIAYKHLIGKLTDYPIPELRLPSGGAKILLDVGCNWGRWCFAAARKGYRPIGIDPSLGAIMAARRVARQLNIDAKFIVGDARFLPLKTGSVDCVFSYSVLQHFSRSDAARAVVETGRVLAPSGNCLVQMPAKLGVRCLYHQARRGFREGEGFAVRYWSIPALRKLFESAVGPTTFSVDCYFGIGLQYSDRHLLPAPFKVAVSVSEILRRCSRFFPPLTWVADSVYVSSTKRKPTSAL